MRYELRDLSYAPGGHTILSHVDFSIKGREHAALVGFNGAGKTTLLKMIKGELKPDRDDKRLLDPVSVSENITIELLDQSLDTESGKSGGETGKRALAEILEKAPDLLLLDEPTNHLDMESIERLEERLRGYPGALLVVSHDRFFLDQVAECVWELADGRLTRYGGNYTAFREEKSVRLREEKKRYRMLKEEEERLTALIEKFKHKPTKAAMARAKKKQLERMGPITEPREDAAVYDKEIIPERPGPKMVLEAKDLVCGYDRELFSLDLKVKRGQKLGLLGRNGCGKTTLLKTLAGKLSPIKGECRISEGVTIGYFDQLAAEEAADRYPEMSGGERAKLVLSEIIEAAPNLLILDEPINHMDIPSREGIEAMLKKYKGTVIFVSHDRYFLSKVADSLLIFEGKEVRYYPFGYEHYLYHKRVTPVGEDAAAVMELTRQTMIAELEAVPRPERGMTRTLSPEVAYRDMRLAAAWEICEDLRIKAQENELRYLFDLSKEQEALREEADRAMEEWTESLISWYMIETEDDTEWTI